MTKIGLKRAKYGFKENTEIVCLFFFIPKWSCCDYYIIGVTLVRGLPLDIQGAWLGFYVWIFNFWGLWDKSNHFSTLRDTSNYFFAQFFSILFTIHTCKNAVGPKTDFYFFFTSHQKHLFFHCTPKIFLFFFTENQNNLIFRKKHCPPPPGW